MGDFLPNTAALQALLKRLFPGVQFSDTAVALLAAEVAEAEDTCELMHATIEQQPNQAFADAKVTTRVFFTHPTGYSAEGIPLMLSRRVIGQGGSHPQLPYQGN